jgi:FMN phosphatase YigB (HAD superfamily)
MSEHIVLFDMDGTLADYKGQMEADLATLASPEEKACFEDGTPFSMSFDDDEKPRYLRNRMRIIKEQKDWWFNLPKMEDGFRVLNIAEALDFEIHILTKGPYRTVSAWSEKVKWCRKYLHRDVKITITEDKGLVYGKILVDDYPGYMDRWLKWRPRGLGIMPLRDYNKDYRHPNVVHFDGTNIDEIKERMTEARNR